MYRECSVMATRHHNHQPSPLLPPPSLQLRGGSVVMGLHHGEDSVLSRVEEVLVNDGAWHHLQLDFSSSPGTPSHHRAVLSLDHGLYLVGAAAEPPPLVDGTGHYLVVQPPWLFGWMSGLRWKCFGTYNNKIMSKKMQEINEKQTNGILRILSNKCITQILQFMFKRDGKKLRMYSLYSLYFCIRVAEVVTFVYGCLLRRKKDVCV